MSEQEFTAWCGTFPRSVLERLAQIKLLIFDVDGTLTDGTIIIDNQGVESKRFSCHDGFGMHALHWHGLQGAIITGRQSQVVTKRAAELELAYVMQGQRDKAKAILSLCAKAGIEPRQCAVMGDDLNDLPMFKLAGFTACPQDAFPYLKSIADLVLPSNGGAGAAREFCDLYLMAQGKIDLRGLPIC